MIRTTLVLEEGLFKKLKTLAVRRGNSLKETITGLLLEGLARNRRMEIPPRFEWRTVDAEPLVDVNDRDAIYNVLDGR
jgi:hypothetical protein